MTVTNYVGEFWREGDVWEARARDYEGIHTFGRTLVKAQYYLHEAIAAWFDVPMEQVTVSVVVLVDGLAEQVSEAVAARRELAEHATRVSAQLTTTALALMLAGLSQREIAVALGLSHQRVQQLLAA